MTPAALRAELERRGVVLRAVGDRLLYRPIEAIDPELRAALKMHKSAVLAGLRSGIAAPNHADHDHGLERGQHDHHEDLAPLTLNSESEGDLLDRFLSDASIPVGIFHSRALDRRFIFARDEAALEALTEADEGLPVLFFGEAEKLSRLGLEGFRAVLDVRAEFGPSVALEKVGHA